MRFGAKALSDTDYYNIEVCLNEILSALGGAGSESNATVSSVDDSDSSQTLLAADSARKGFIIYNNSAVILYAKFASTAATDSDFTVRINPFQVHEEMGAGIYKGAITGIWASDGSGAALVTSW